MTRAAFQFLTQAKPRMRWEVLMAFALCPALLALSGSGFWQWLTVASHTQMMEENEIFYLICLAIIPLILFVFLSVVSAQRIEHMRLSTSYQTRFDQLQKRIHYQEDLAQLIMNCRPESIAIFDGQNRYWFVNQFACKELNLEPKDVIGKSLSRILGHEKARKTEARLSEVNKTGRAIEVIDQVTDANGVVRFIKMHYEAVRSSSEFSGGVIMREEDVTNFIVERERRESMLRQVIATLVAVVDRRDPYAAGHSARVGQLARGIAEEMAIDGAAIETAEVAGSLMNFGKVLVPREILTKTSPLTADELQRVRDSILTSADILSIIEFVGPVVPTLRQVLERYDGTGVPLGIKGKEIMPTARIVTAANAYVALVSPRAHRPSMEFSEALKYMMNDAGKAFDKDVLVALESFLKNRSTSLHWLTRTRQT